MHLTSISRVLAAFSMGVIMTQLAVADDAVFSGPQPGEKLSSFRVVSVFGETAGKEVDLVKAAEGNPTLLIFVHKLTRPGMALTRSLTAYSNAKRDKGVASGIVWLAEDKAEAENYLNRAAKSLNFVVPVGVSIDGEEGPGSYGLNRNVELTILIAKDNKVTANFALVQPSVTEAPKIATALAKLIDQPPPTAEEMNKLAYPKGDMAARTKMRRGGSKTPATPATPVQRGELRTVMQKLIRASDEKEVRTVVKEINDWVGENKQRQASLGKMADAVLQRGMGPDMAQSSLKQWRDKYAPKREQGEPK